jgi:hypothetical protein
MEREHGSRPACIQTAAPARAARAENGMDFLARVQPQAQPEFPGLSPVSVENSSQQCYQTGLYDIEHRFRYSGSFENASL